ncbi:MAG TPA: uroporphyrinogen-III synthase [Verrucomicrobiae bacterium]|nr:uroporphyrinogen-III synthase [Verrucomicrobiae bacterium]
MIKKFPQLKIASIGPETSKPLTALGVKAAVEAETHTIDGLVQAILAARPGPPS